MAEGDDGIQRMGVRENRERGLGQSDCFQGRERRLLSARTVVWLFFSLLLLLQLFRN